MTDEKDERVNPFQHVAELVYQEDLGALDARFLAQPVSCLPHRDPICVGQDATVHEVMALLKRYRFGCVLIVDNRGRLIGIFSERDYVLKVYASEIDANKTPISEVMTREPITQPPDAPLAHVLNMMSNGGFRHIPIVDDVGAPLWMVSVKNIMDYIVADVGNALMNFKTEDWSQ